MAEDLQAALDLHPHRTRFPSRVLEVLKEQNQDGSSLILAWELASWVPGLDPAERQRLLAVCLALLAVQGQGHTRMALNPAGGSPADAILRAFPGGTFPLRPFLEGPRLASIAGDGARPLVLSGDWLYSHRFLTQERSLCRAVLRLGARPPREGAPVGEEVFGDPVLLNEEQRRAVAMALEGSLTLVTGGPGTGKTSIVVSILRALMRQPGIGLEDIALAAPTGKAAQRMGESIRGTLARVRTPGKADGAFQDALLEPRTLHRLLAWHPASERFRHGPGNPLPARVVLVDEASMISQEHMFHLLGALRDDARLVLLGDADQLPSVEAGCAFQDLVKSLPRSRARLLQSYRMREEDPDGRNILSVARTLKDPSSGDLWGGPEPIHRRGALDQLQSRQVELLDPATVGMKAFLRHWFDREVMGLSGFPSLARRIFTFREGAWGPGDEEAIRALNGHFDAFRILCALRESGDLRGVEEINALLHGWMLPVTGEGLRGPTAFCSGEPVSMTANDYRRGIFNGDQGLVLKVRSGDQVHQAAVFSRGGAPVPFPLEPLRHQLEHAYAMTIHKSQGSEYTRIAIVLPRTNHKALTRELLYTGLTRARKSVVLLSEEERIPFAAANPSRRDSGLGERLEAAGEPGRA